MTKYIFTRDLPPMKYKKGDKMDKHLHGEALWATWLALGYIEEVKYEEFPSKGMWYKWIDVCGKIHTDLWNDTLDDLSRNTVGNCYRTEAEALEAKARVERAYKGI